MNSLNGDWRWPLAIVLVLLFLTPRNSGLSIVLLTLGAALAIGIGLAPWRGSEGAFSGPKVTYWRGRRIEIPQSSRQRLRSLPPARMLLSLASLALGLWLAYTAFLALIRLLGVG